MTKPDFIDWAATDNVYPVLGESYDGQPNKVAVTSGQAQYGWEPGKKPPAQNMNSWQNLAGQWVRRFDAADGEAQALLGSGSLGDGFYSNLPLDNLQFSAAVFAAGAAHGAPYISGRTITVGNGILYQATASEIFAYHVTTNELSVDITDGDATHPRVDLVQCKIEADTSVAGQRTKITVEVKTGTPAVSPAVPAPDSGFVALYTVLVGQNWVGASGFIFDDLSGAVASVHDQRIPLRARQYTTQGADSVYDSGTWTLSSYGRITASNASPADVQIFCSAGEGGGRLMGAGMMGQLPAGHSHSGVDFQLSQIRFASGGPYVAQVGQLTGSYGSGLTITRAEQFRYVLDGTHVPGAGGPVVTPYTSGDGFVLGVPLWSNGRRAFQAFPTADEQCQLMMTLTNCKNVQILDSAWFWIAG